MKRGARTLPLPRWELWLARGIAITVGTLTALIVVEVGLRWIIPLPTVDLFVYDPASARHRIMRPKVVGQIYGVPFETNAQGFRSGRDYVRAKAPGVVRVAVLGDSFTVGAGVALADTFTARLQETLRIALPEMRIELYSFAVAGHEILHHAATLQEAALDYSPDAVLLFLFPYNDLDAERYDREARVIAAHARGEPLPVPGAQRAWWESLRTAKVLTWQAQIAMREIGPLESLLPPLRFERVLARYREEGRAWQRSRQALSTMGRQLRQAGIGGRAYLLPLNGRSYEQQRPLYEAAGRLGRSSGWETRSLLEGFEAAGRASHEYSLNLLDSHPDADYHARVAELLGLELSEWLPEIIKEKR